MSSLVLVRHGKSLWNLENRFTGWTDVSLSKEGEKELACTGHLCCKRRAVQVPPCCHPTSTLTTLCADADARHDLLR